MNIPDEVQKAADDLYWDRGKQYGGFGCAEEAYEYIAEWARKEALREAADYIEHPKHPGLDWYTLSEVGIVLRALAEAAPA